MDKEKLNNIYNLQSLEIKEILYTCIDALGAVDINESCNALGVKRARIYQLMNENNTIKIGNHKYLCINLINKCQI